MKEIRQGDVLLVPVAPINATAATPAPITLASGQGESGQWHAHVLTAAVAVAEGIVRIGDDGARLECRDSGGNVLEQRHATLPVPAGDYRVVRQREWWPDAPREVRD